MSQMEQVKKDYHIPYVLDPDIDPYFYCLKYRKLNISSTGMKKWYVQYEGKPSIYFMKNRCHWHIVIEFWTVFSVEIQKYALNKNPNNQLVILVLGIIGTGTGKIAVIVSITKLVNDV